tara:strand:- start:81 stop:644 length:564 start_codon:yes stop_codon:yes gene_type:complete
MVRRRNFEGASIFTSSDDGESTGSSGDESADVTLPNDRRKGPRRCARKSWCVLKSDLQTTVTLPLGNPSRRAVKTKADKREVEPKHRIIDSRGDDGRGQILVELHLVGVRTLAELVDCKASPEISDQAFKFAHEFGLIDVTQSTFHLRVPGRWRANVALPAKVCERMTSVRVSLGDTSGKMVFTLLV